MRHPVPAMDEKLCINGPMCRVCTRVRVCSRVQEVDVADGRERGVEYLSVNKSEVVVERCPAKAHAPHGGVGPVKRPPQEGHDRGGDCGHGGVEYLLAKEEVVVKPCDRLTTSIGSP